MLKSGNSYTKIISVSKNNVDFGMECKIGMGTRCNSLKFSHSIGLFEGIGYSQSYYPMLQGIKL